MILLRFYHAEQVLELDGKTYKATCKVRNEINNKRNIDEPVFTYPTDGQRKPYYPRKFPTGLWEVKQPIYTKDSDYAPVKIPTTAKRNVLTWYTDHSEYKKPTDDYQEDSFYHLHFAKNSRTTLGCIRLNSADDALEIASVVDNCLSNHNVVYLEVLASKE